jgi:hypothetical protein
MSLIKILKDRKFRILILFISALTLFLIKREKFLKDPATSHSVGYTVLKKEDILHDTVKYVQFSKGLFLITTQQGKRWSVNPTNQKGENVYQKSMALKESDFLQKDNGNDTVFITRGNNSEYITIE